MDTTKHAWIPALAPLISIVAEQESPDLVLNDFMAVGFNFSLPPELQKTFGPRKRAYVQEVQDWVDGELNWTAQWALARALAKLLFRKNPSLVRERLSGVGWSFDGTQFVPLESGGIDDHVFFPAGAVHDAFVHIRTLFKEATRELFIIDGYVNNSLYEFLLSTNGPTTCRLLTSQQLPHDFLTEAKHFTQQHRFTLAIRVSNAFHDRQIILDGTRAFILGASIKDAGKRAFHIIPIENASARAEMIRYAEEIWEKAAVLM